MTNAARQEARRLFGALTGIELDATDPAPAAVPIEKRPDPLAPNPEETGRRFGW